MESAIGQIGAAVRDRGPGASRDAGADTTKSRIVLAMNDAPPVRINARNAVVRPRDAASLILLRGEGRALEVLAGRRPLHVKFMPGVYVFPGGAIDPQDGIAWRVETGTETLAPQPAALRPRRAARDLGGGRRPVRPAGAAGRRLRSASPVEQAYPERGVVAASTA